MFKYLMIGKAPGPSEDYAEKEKLVEMLKLEC